VDEVVEAEEAVISEEDLAVVAVDSAEEVNKSCQFETGIEN
jgi:hypothetical protein